jgi:exodeoxyribonuclease-3
MISGFLPIEREWIDKFISHGYIDTFRMFHPEPNQYTWWSLRTRARKKNIGWRIDYFFVNERFRGSVTDSFILSDVHGSDHCPIGIEITKCS